MPTKSPLETLKNTNLLREIAAPLNETNPENALPSVTLKVSQIVTSKQPRRYFDPEELANLEISIRAVGILQPLIVRPVGENSYELVTGERRYRAAKSIGLEEVPVIIKSLDEKEATQIALIENLQRANLNPVEETKGILELLSLKLEQPAEEIIRLLYQMDNEKKGKVTHNVIGSETAQQIQDVFENLGKISWESFVSNRFPLLKLSPSVLECLERGEIAYTKALAIAKVKDEVQRENLLAEAITQDYSLAQIKEKIKNLTNSQPKTDSPKNRIRVLTTQLTQNKLWEKDAKKWKKIEALLSKLETLLEEDIKLPN